MAIPLSFEGVLFVYYKFNNIFELLELMMPYRGTFRPVLVTNNLKQNFSSLFGERSSTFYTNHLKTLLLKMFPKNTFSKMNKDC